MRRIATALLLMSGFYTDAQLYAAKRIATRCCGVTHMLTGTTSRKRSINVLTHVK